MRLLMVACIRAACRLTAVAGVSFTFLGTGTSVGVPVIGCGCAVCTSEDPRNRRLRSSALLRAGDTAVLVDSGPDLRMQALREGIREIDAIVYTHAHLDHVAGFDELRAFCWRRDEPLPMHATEECLSTLKQMYGWAFSEDNRYLGYVRPDARVIEGAFLINDVRITPLPVVHSALKTVGFLFEYPGARSLAYLPDVKRIPDDTFDLMHGADVLVVDALRPGDHPTHFSLVEALEAVERCGVGEAWLTHLGHENDHASLDGSLPDGVRVAWDGLRIEL